MSNFSQKSEQSNSIRIKIIGLGGAGSNMINRLKLDDFDTISTIAVNTDAQALANLQCDEKVLLGSSITRGLGTGGELEIGKTVAEAERGKMASLVSDADLIILVVGLGGGTGSAVTALIAELAANTDALVLAFATLPFSFEGSRRKHIAAECLGTLRKWVHGLIPLPNDVLLQEGEEDTSVLNAFAVADSWVERGIHSLCTLLLQNGLINQDFGSLRSVFQGQGGKTLFGIGSAEGENYVEEALENLFLCPLLHMGDRPTRLDRILVNLIGSPDLSLSKINEIMSFASKRFSTREDIIFGAVIDPTKSQSLEICVLGKAEMEHPASETTGEIETAQPIFGAAKDSEDLAASLADRASFGKPVHQSKLKASEKETRDAQDEFVFNQLEEQRGYFEKTDRNEYQGEDLDVPTYLRRGIKIKLKV
ncbi:MAG: cell division protein FtsZ [Lentimonas sp.]|jgi:cell division protein FtsZ